MGAPHIPFPSCPRVNHFNPDRLKVVHISFRNRRSSTMGYGRHRPLGMVDGTPRGASSGVSSAACLQPTWFLGWFLFAVGLIASIFSAPQPGLLTPAQDVYGWAAAPEHPSAHENQLVAAPVKTQATRAAVYSRTPEAETTVRPPRNTIIMPASKDVMAEARPIQDILVQPNRTKSRIFVFRFKLPL